MVYEIYTTLLQNVVVDCTCGLLTHVTGVPKQAMQGHLKKLQFSVSKGQFSGPIVSVPDAPGAFQPSGSTPMARGGPPPPGKIQTPQASSASVAQKAGGLAKGGWAHLNNNLYGNGPKIFSSTTGFFFFFSFLVVLFSPCFKIFEKKKFFLYFLLIFSVQKRCK